MKRLLPALVLLASAYARAQIDGWHEGNVCRVVVPGTMIGLLGRTRDAGLMLARLRSRKEIVAAMYGKNVVKVNAGLRVGILEIITAPMDEK